MTSGMFMDRREICALLGCGRSSFEVRVATGEFPPPSLGGKGRPRRWRRAVVMDWLAREERETARRYAS